MTNDIRDAAQRIIEDDRMGPYDFDDDAEKIARAVLAAPRWHARPTVPGLWAYRREGEEPFPFAAQEFTAEQIARGVPFRVSAVFGPIPECDVKE
jgi:hypothetical protein